jgi:CRISPR-associated protein Csc3
MHSNPPGEDLPAGEGLPLVAALFKDAKGGIFAEEKVAEGAQTERYSHDQSLLVHILNGLLPAARIARMLKADGIPRMVRYFDELTYRLFCMGYTLHDWEKIPPIRKELDRLGGGRREVEPRRRLMADWIERLGLDRFFDPTDPTAYHQYVDEVFFIAANTQVVWGTVRSPSRYSALPLQAKSRHLAQDLSTLADRLASVARTPLALARHPSVRDTMGELGGDRLRLEAHGLADNRGILTNILNNALLDLLRTPNRQPLLYSPSGVVYVATGARVLAPPIEEVIERCIEKLRALCAPRVKQHLHGVARREKGLKYPSYYWSFFTVRELLHLAAEAAQRRIPESKAPYAGARRDKIASWPRSGAFANIVEATLDFPADIRVDQLGECCALVAKIAADATKYGSARDSPEVATAALLDNLKLTPNEMDAYRAIKAYRLAGGVPYHWYYAAGRYFRHHPGDDPAAWRDLLHTLAERTADAIEQRAGGVSHDLWQPLRRYIKRVVQFSWQGREDVDLRNAAAGELERYRGVKKPGSGVNVCSLCSSDEKAEPQEETAVLFAPAVYSNHQVLGSSNTSRSICPICSMEMMLRQIMMTPTRVTGGAFEKRKQRYIYLYPAYFFSPETQRFVSRVYNRLRGLRFINLQRRLFGDSGDELPRLEVADLEAAAELLIGPPVIATAVDPDVDALEDEDVSEGPQELAGAAQAPVQSPVRYMQRIEYPETDPLTVFFYSVPVQRDTSDRSNPRARDAGPTETESWVEPTLHALLLPILLGVKVAATSSAIPIATDGAQFPETVLFDAVPPFLMHLLPSTRLILDGDKGVPSSLRAVLAAYQIHLDLWRRRGPQGTDFNWTHVAGLARDLETSPLYAFAHLKQALRQQDQDSNVVPIAKARQYLALVTKHIPKGAEAMNHPERLTELYMAFYRHERGHFNSNAILKPLREAADVVLRADDSMFINGGLLLAVQGRLNALMESVGRRGAGGYRCCAANEQEQRIRAFAKYFVDDVFHGACNGDRARLRGRQLNLLMNACEIVYRVRDAAEWEARKAAVPQAAE